MRSKTRNARSFLESLDREASELRFRAARELSPYKSAANQQFGDKSHFKMYCDVLPLPSGRAALGFNRDVTDYALRHYVLKESDPLRVTYLGAKVIEQTFYQFFDPAQPESPIKNLSVSKHFGTFFTPHVIADLMATGLVATNRRETLLDPCVGSGVLLCAALLNERGNQYKRLIGVELDDRLARWAAQIVSCVAGLTGFSGRVDIAQGNGLEYLLNLPDHIPVETCDIIINPPYGRFRLTADRATNAETALIRSQRTRTNHLSKLREHVADHAQKIRDNVELFSTETGILEHSRLYFRACARNAAAGARVSIISPDSWLCGNDGVSLRAFLVEQTLIERIVIVREDRTKFSTVNQATAITFLSPSPKNAFQLELFGVLDRAQERIYFTDLINAKGRKLVIPRIAGRELTVFQKLRSLQTIGQLDWITNARGEIDQTLQKKLFSQHPTNVKLVRGEHLERFVFRHSSNDDKPSYLNERGFEKFIRGKPKSAHFSSWRIAGRQCSYAQQRRRLVFALVPPNHALGNSCNYLMINCESSLREERRSLVLGLLSSAVLDWFFRSVNSNNHVGNYEIDSLPFPSNSKWFPGIALTIRQITGALESGRPGKAAWLQHILEALVGLSYGLDPESDLRLVLDRVGDLNVDKIVNFASQFLRGVELPLTGDTTLAFNHEVPTLSDLDRRVISHVPEGGNWQNIPECVPGERLKQIREMTAWRGVVRTTYYGRLRRDQPAYTINTYFNRPGNGTHIHPILNRTLTSREAARLQSFPDSYLFAGGAGAVRDQVGNAVPPLLAQAIGKALLPYRKTGQCIDVFCGAGGMSLGLESAGWEILAAIDNNREALDSYALNRPCELEPTNAVAGKTSLYRRDLHDQSVFEDLIARLSRPLNGKKLDILVGGPPCQGFSHAGFRLAFDKRNDLASTYLHFAERLRPRLFILENVEGLLTYKQGEVLRDILCTLRELGYRVADPVWRLGSEQYGVPQMRRRVFVVASLDDSVDLRPPSPTHERCAGRREDKRTGSLFDLVLSPPTTVAEALSGLSLPRLSGETSLTTWLENHG